VTNPSTHPLPPVLVIVGPTASGKTTVSLEIAARIRGEIISADSRQVYRHLDIGTAKPTLAERRRVVHHFVDMLLPDQEFSAGEFGSLGREAIQQIIERGNTPIVVGGSGLYVRSLIDGLFEGPGADRELRAKLQRRLQDEGMESMLKELRVVDPETARRADPTKPRRILRALEIFHSTGTPISAHHAGAKVRIAFSPVQVGLAWERSELYRRIEQRCEAMLAAGLLTEVELLEREGYTPTLNALNTVGYAEAFAYRRGETSFEEMVRQFKQNSRRYAKRQLTWFRADKRIAWLKVDESDDLRHVGERIVEIFLNHVRLA